FGQAKPEAHAQGESPSTSRPEKDEDADEEYEPDAHFEPVIPLPSLVEVKTGEEEEEVLFSERGRLYRFLADTKEYKERGTGDIKILRHPTTNRYRVVMRREQVLKLCANFSLVPGMKAVSRQDGKPTCTFTATDFAEDPAGELLTLTVRFRTEDNRNRFVELFDQGVEAAVARQAQAPQDEEEQQEESADKQDDLEVTATLAEAYPSPLRPAKVLKDTRMLLKCVYEDLPGVGPVYHIYFHNAATKKVEFSHFVRDEISLVDKDEGVSYSATNPEGVTYNVDITFDCADDDDAFRDNFHDGVVLLEGEGEEDEEEYEDYEGHEEYDE
uniref:RanBD1 domain-containing protein n=1 Tax=Steinernema glaseri TaxID=37863 RepID=A0A1I7Y0W0_9BILA